MKAFLKTTRKCWGLALALCLVCIIGFGIFFSFYSTGQKYLISDGKTVVTDCSEQVCFLDILTGKVIQQSWLFGEMMSGPPIILKNNELVVSTKKS